MLAELSQAGLTVGLATSKLVDFAERIVAQLTIGDYFEVVAGAARDGTRITKTDIVAFALESLGRPQPGAVALVGDRGDGMRAAVLHGLLPVGVSWGYGDKEELQASGSQMIIDHPSAVTRLLTS